VATVFLWSAAAATVLPLTFVIAHLVVEGAAVLSPTFLTALPRPVGDTGGGIANAIGGTLLLVTGAAVLAVPVGVGTGLYLAGGPAAAGARLVRLTCDVLNGVPAIVIGIVAWTVVVRPMRGFSALAGIVALAAIATPLVARATEEVVRLVPAGLREAALALGYGEWRTALTVVLPAARAGVVTGVLVALARVAGESAALIFTAFGSPFWSLRLDQPVAALPLTVYQYALSPAPAWQHQAWGAAVVLLVVVGVMSALARLVVRAPRGDDGRR
jgi:phosphate transport system permease protein